MNAVKRMFELRLTPREAARAKRMMAIVMLPILIFYMTSMNILVGGMMRAQAADEEEATGTVAKEEAPKAEPARNASPSVAGGEKTVEVKEVAKEEVKTEVKTEEPKVEPARGASQSDAGEEKTIETPEEAIAPAAEAVGPVVESAPETAETKATDSAVGTVVDASAVKVQPTGEDVIIPEAVSAEEAADSPVSEPEWKIDANGKTAAIGPVELDKTYRAPQNDKVAVTFTKLPEQSGQLIIKEIKLSAEEQINLGALSNIAYDITSDMKDGSFSYNLTLPYPDKDSDGKAETSSGEVRAGDLQVLYTEKKEGNLAKDDMKEINDQKDAKKSEKVIEIKGLDHFTIFVVSDPNPAGNGNDSNDFCASATPGGVFQCYDTLTAAIAAVLSGGTVIVKAGIYTESPTVNKNLTVELTGDVTFSETLTVNSSATLTLKQHEHTLTAGAINNKGTIKNEAGDGNIILVASTGDIIARNITSTGDVSLTATSGNILDDPSGAQGTYIAGTNITLSAPAGSIGTYAVSPADLDDFNGAVDVKLGGGTLTANALNDIAVTEVGSANINSADYNLTSATAGKYIIFGNMIAGGSLIVDSALDSDALVRLVSANNLTINTAVSTSANTVDFYAKGDVTLNKSVAAANTVTVKSGFNGGSGSIIDDGSQSTTISAHDIILNANGGSVSDVAPVGDGTIDFLVAVDVALGSGTLTTNGGYVTETNGVRNGTYNLNGGDLSLSKAFSGVSTLTSDNGKLVISDDDTFANILIGEYSGAVVGGLSGAVSVGDYYEIQTEGTISYPLDVQLNYTDGEIATAGVTETQLNGVYYYDGSWQMYPVADTTVDRGANTILVHADHLTPIVAGADTTAPTVNITAPLAVADVAASSVITFADDETTNPECSVDNTNWTACTTGVTTLGDIPEFLGLGNGVFTLYLKDTDLVGNTGTDSEAGINKNDTTAPSVTLNALSPDPNNGNTPTLSGNVQDVSSNITLVEYEINDSGSWIAASAADGIFDENNEDFTFTTAVLADASHTIKVRATDTAGNTTAIADYASDTFSIDSTVPTFTMQYYSDSALSVSLGDNPQLKAGTYYIKITSSETLDAAPEISIEAEGSANDVSGEAATSVGGNDYKYTREVAYDAAAVGAGLEDISLTGTDTVGNTVSDASPTNEAAKAARIDTVGPLVTVNTKNTRDTTPFLTGTYSDTNGVVSIGITVFGHTYTATIDYAGINTWGASVTDVLVDGVYDVLASAIDPAGNTGNDSTTNELSVSITVPQLVRFSSSTADGTYGVGDSINIIAEYNKDLDSRSNLTVTLDTGHSVLLDNVSGSDISGTYTVVSGESSADLTVSSITEEDVNDPFANHQESSVVPASPDNIADSSDIVVDGIAPGAIVSTTSSSPTNVSPIPVTITFTEDVTGFTVDDIAVTNGVKSDFALDTANTVWTVNVTPLGQGAVTVQVPADSAADAGGNGNTVSNLLSVTYDTVAPVLSEITPVPDPTNDTTPDYTFNSGEAGNITYGGDCSSGTATAIAGDSTVTFNALAEGIHNNCAITVTDAAGNPSLALVASSFRIDVTGPTVTLSTLASDPTNAGFMVTAQFSETVTGFTVDDFSVANGSKSDFSAVDGDTYTVVVTPLADGVVTVDVGAAVAQDNAGNDNAAADQLSRTYDHTAPVLQSFTSSTSDETYGPTSSINVTANYDENLSAGSAITVKLNVGPALSLASVTLDNVSGSALAGTYTVGATGSEQNTADLAIDAITDQDALDTAGNHNTATALPASNISDTSDIAIDTTAPNAPTLTDEPDTSNPKPTLDWSDESGSGAEKYHLLIDNDSDFSSPSVNDSNVAANSYTPGVDLPEGAIYWKVSSIDHYGNESVYSGADDFQMDLTNPISAILTTGQLTSGEYTAQGGNINGTASDEGSGVALVSITIQNKKSGDADENKYWDGGNWATGETWLVAAGTTTWNYAFAPADGYIYEIKSKAEDGAGNVQDPVTSGTFTYDTTDPASIGVIANAVYGPNTWSAADTINGTAADAATGVAGVTITLEDTTAGKYWDDDSWEDGATNLTASGTTVWTYTLANVNLTDAHSYTVTPTATDGAGNSAAGTADSFGYDSSVATPALSLDGGAVYTTDQNVTADIGNDAEAAAWYLSETNSAPAFDSPSWVAEPATFDLSAGDGAKTVYAFVKDALDNVSASGSDSITLDSIKPVIDRSVIKANNASVSGKIKQSDIYQIYAQITDNLSGVNTKTVDVSNVIFGNVAAALSESGSWTIDGQTYNYRSAELTADAVLAEGAKTYTVDADDLAGNNADQFSGALTVDNTVPTLSLVNIASDNIVTNLAKVGNIVTVSFTASEDIQTPMATISGHAAVITAGVDAQHWSAAYAMTDSDAEGAMTFSLSFTDLAGNAGVAVSAVTDGSSVTFDKTAPTLTTVSIVSDNSTNTDYAKTGDIVTLTIISGEDIQTPSAMIATHSAAIVAKGDAQHWTATYTMTDSDTEGTVSFTVDFADLAGNIGTQAVITTDASTVAFDKTDPDNPDFRTDEGLWYKSRPTDLDIDFSDDRMLQKVEYKLGSGGSWRTIEDDIDSADRTSNWALNSSDWDDMNQGENYHLWFRGTDKAGNTNTTSSNSEGFWLGAKDTHEPNAPTYNTAEGQTFSSNPTLDIDFSDSLTLDRIRYQLDGSGGNWTTLADKLDGKNYTANWSMSSGIWDGLTTDAHYIYFQITDDAGNTYTTGSDHDGFAFYKNNDTGGIIAGVENNGGEGQNGEQVQGEQNPQGAIPGEGVEGEQIVKMSSPWKQAWPYETTAAVLLLGSGIWWWIKRSGKGMGGGGVKGFMFATLKSAAGKARIFFW